MRVAFNARLLASPSLRGWNRYTVNLLQHLPGQGVELFLFGDGPLHKDHLARLPSGGYQVRVAPLRYPLWEQYWLPRQCVRDRIDILHCPFHFGLPVVSLCPRILTLHDAIDHVYHHPRRSWWEALRPASLRAALYQWIARSSADQVITVSKHSRDDLVRHLKLNPRRLTVVPEAADPHFHRPVSAEARESVRQTHHLLRPYFVYVGGWERRKNIPFLVEAFATANVPGVELVLAGGREEERQAMLAQTVSLGLTDRVRLLGWVAEADLPALYAEALAFVYPSQYEGFGLQLCEAMAVGCPVLAARATSLPEVLGEGGETFPLDEKKELANRLDHLARDKESRARLGQAARERSRAFDWRRTAAETVAVYRRALAA